IEAVDGIDERHDGAAARGGGERGVEQRRPSRRSAADDFGQFALRPATPERRIERRPPGRRHSSAGQPVLDQRAIAMSGLKRRREALDSKRRHGSFAFCSPVSKASIRKAFWTIKGRTTPVSITMHGYLGR